MQKAISLVTECLIRGSHCSLSRDLAACTYPDINSLVSLQPSLALCDNALNGSCQNVPDFVNICQYCRWNIVVIGLLGDSAAALCITDHILIIKLQWFSILLVYYCNLFLLNNTNNFTIATWAFFVSFKATNTFIMFDLKLMINY